MAWFRAGGAGIPSSLKSAMNSVLNKKFGTSTTYPPSDWPADVNLLGPLPEKTASGAIASFSDGADDVPLKSLVFGIEPIQAAGTPSPSNPLPISGHTSLTGVHCGKNLFDKTATDTTKGFISGKYIDNTGTEVSNTNYNVSEYILLDSGADYTLSGTTGNAPAICLYDKDKAFVRGIRYYNQNRSFTTGSTEVYCRISYREDEKDEVMLEVGSQATTYAPYSAESKKWDWSEL